MAYIYTPLSFDALRTISEGAIAPIEQFQITSDWPRLAYRVHYPNGYGASIVKHGGSYGHADDLFEVAVLDGDELCYSTEITDDVIGYLSEAEVIDICRQIREL